MSYKLTVAIFYVNIVLIPSNLAFKEDTFLNECDSSACARTVLQKLFFDKALANKIEQHEDSVELKIKLSRSDYDIIEEFVKNKDSWSKHDSVLRILSESCSKNMFDIDDFDHNYSSLSPSLIIILSIGSVAICSIWMILSSNSRPIAAVLIIIVLFSVGLGWNWWKQYKEEFSKRVHLLPTECKPDEASWYHSVKGYIIDPKCDEYYMAPVDDPLAMVSPRLVVKETFEMFTVTPFSLITSAIISAIHQLSDNLVWPLNWIVQLTLSILALGGGVVILITFMAGAFNLNLKFNLGPWLQGELTHLPQSNNQLLQQPTNNKIKMIKR